MRQSVLLSSSQLFSRPGVRQVSEGSREQRKMEETGCEIICGACRTLAIKREANLSQNCMFLHYHFPEVTICSWQDSKIQKLPNSATNFFFLSGKTLCARLMRMFEHVGGLLKVMMTSFYGAFSPDVTPQWLTGLKTPTSNNYGMFDYTSSPSYLKYDWSLSSACMIL